YKQKQFKGTVAWGGFRKIRGSVRVVLDEKDFSKFKKGEILVTDETDASFLPLMQKAKAMITDEGGILCHAAIVAREMKKPCVVGTKVASRVLKTGDKVEIAIDKHL
ncbi:MAG: PEP-utilizing enzyme, partial [Bacillota bacterium]|nr:PEP-utilizing enzyme [Bacillota bacterium]